MESKLRDLITAEARTYTQAGGKIKAIAAKTELAQSTISKLIYGETKWPRLHTVLVLLEFFGYELQPVKVEARLRIVK